MTQKLYDVFIPKVVKTIKSNFVFITICIYTVKIAMA